MGIWLLIGNIMLLLFGFVVFLVLSCVGHILSYLGVTGRKPRATT